MKNSLIQSENKKNNTIFTRGNDLIQRFFQQIEILNFSSKYYFEKLITLTFIFVSVLFSLWAAC